MYVNVSDKIIITFLTGGRSPISGTVEKIRDGELTATFILDWEESLIREECSVKFVPSDIVFRRKIQALEKLPYLNNDLINLLCRKYPKIRNMPEMNLHLPSNYEFNESQQKAIRMAVSNPFSLIQGPPGTGKTHTIGAIAIQALRNEPFKKVLICGTTNVSITSLLEIVGDMVQGEGYKVCWPAASTRDFINEEYINKEQQLMTLYKACHMGSDDSKRFKKLRETIKLTEEENKEMEKLREKLERQIIAESDVIFSTLDSSGKRSIVESIGDISTLIVDEATLSVESSMIIPLSLLPDRFVLVGDQKQLGPQSSFDDPKLKGYYYSMFERIIREQSCLDNSIMLNVQYRMHPDISYLPNKLFYEGLIADGVKSEDRVISKNFIFQKHINFINTKGEEEKIGTSYINHDEKDQISKFVNSLVDSGVNPSQIGIISAYGAQAGLISDHFKNKGLRVKISTIDSFQGSQKDYIIICTTRNGPDIGFLKDKRRMNVAITRARCLVAIFGNEETLIQSEFWSNAIKHCKSLNSFYDRLPIKIEKVKLKPLIISKTKNDVVQDFISEFKEDEHNAGYNLSQIYSEISDSTVRILWPDEKEDVVFLTEWVQKRVQILDDNYNVTLAYDAEGVCMQFGDIFNADVDYYNWNKRYNVIPEIKTNESIIISFYKHKNDHELNPILVETMKPLLEHERVTFITFDFTYDFDKFFSFGVNIKTKRIIDAQLMIMPSQSELNETKDLICSTGWISIGEFIKKVNIDNTNANIIKRAKECILKGMKKFPHEENNFLVSQFNYPMICKFTKLFIEYSAGDIFYTAITGVDILSRGELDVVKERSLEKLDMYMKYKNEYNLVQNVRQAYYVRGSFTSVTTAQFSKENQTYQILSYYKKLHSFVELFDNCPKLLQEIIPFKRKDESIIRGRYNDIVDIMKNPDNVHLGNIKDKAILAYVQGVQKKPAFVLRVADEIDEVHEELKKEDESIKKEEEAIQQITGGKNSFKSDNPVWSKVDMSKPCNITENKYPIHYSIPIKNIKQSNTSYFNKSNLIKKSDYDNNFSSYHTNIQKQVSNSDYDINTENIPSCNSESQQSHAKLPIYSSCPDLSSSNSSISSQQKENPMKISKPAHSAWTSLKMPNPIIQENDENISNYDSKSKQSQNIKHKKDSSGPRMSILNLNNSSQQDDTYDTSNVESTNYSSSPNLSISDLTISSQQDENQIIINKPENIDNHNSIKSTNEENNINDDHTNFNKQFSKSSKYQNNTYKSISDFKSVQPKAFYNKNPNHSSAPLISIVNHETSSQQDETSNSFNAESTIYSSSPDLSDPIMSSQQEEKPMKISRPPHSAWTSLKMPNPIIQENDENISNYDSKSKQSQNIKHKKDLSGPRMSILNLNNSSQQDDTYDTSNVENISNSSSPNLSISDLTISSQQDENQIIINKPENIDNHNSIKSTNEENNINDDHTNFNKQFSKSSKYQSNTHKLRYNCRPVQPRTFHNKKPNHSSAPLISIVNHETSSQQDETSNSSSPDLSVQQEENQMKISKPVKTAWTNFTESHQTNQKKNISPQKPIKFKPNQIDSLK